MSKKESMENSVAKMAKFRKAALRNKSHNLLPSAKLVLFDLLEHYNHATGQCNPSHKTIAKNLGISKTTVADAIRSLKSTGWITVKQRYNNSCWYTFDWIRPESDELAESAEADAMSEPLEYPDGTPIPREPESYRGRAKEGYRQSDRAISPERYTPIAAERPLAAERESYSGGPTELYRQSDRAISPERHLTNESTKELIKEGKLPEQIDNPEDEIDWFKGLDLGH